MKYSLYPGCAGEATAKEALLATRSVLKFLGMDITENNAYSCCGAGVVEEEDPEFEYTLNARNFALAEKQQRQIVVICNTCLLTMLKAKKTLAENQLLYRQINADLKKIGLEYRGEVNIKHLLWLLRDDIGLDRLKELIKVPISNVIIAPFYGCHIIRPSEVIGDDKEPDFLSRLIEICGAKEADYEDKYNCCGFHILLNDQATALKMTERCLSHARKAEADMLVTPCTLCHLSLDGYQKPASGSRRLQIPVLHLAQMLGLALGIAPKKLGVDKNMVGMEKYIPRG
ncbi:MAG: CoB--CoM heterodisulfide reductase iron-sulfur subunit B family protein [Deltaproteobacteria bacterium]|nr:CoB--CoM heterodisulfide reductase iron-sulfur subunit B family protein [Deltaproteobacteria bacterium]